MSETQERDEFGWLLPPIEELPPFPVEGEIVYSVNGVRYRCASVSHPETGIWYYDLVPDDADADEH